MAARPMLLHGSESFGRSGIVTPVYSPADNVTAIGSYHRAEPLHIELIERAAEQGFQDFRRTSASRRAEILDRLADGIQAQADTLALLITREAGKPIRLSRVEVERAIRICRGYAREAERQWPLSPTVEGYTARVARFPRGPALAITPYNFPLSLVVHKLAPALAAGCSITIKPAPQTPLTALFLGRLAVESGYEAISVVPADADVSEALVRSNVFATISFTGSSRVGWHIRQIAGNKAVTLELGGNAALIIDEASRPLPEIADRAAFGAFAYAGQICISVQRIFVRRALLETFLPELIRASRALRVGDPLKPDTDVGPMIHVNEVQRARTLIKDALKSGANVLYGGNTYNAFTLNPTLLDRTTPEMRVNAEEAFAPLATVTAYDTFEEALALANRSRYGLQAGVYTADPARMEQAWQSLEVGGVLINEIPSFRADLLPYGGVKDSGLGREGVMTGIEEYTYLKTFLQKH
jgi:acyl-CoA reductase-like NAD-dependent aldehyde dehydrogenase